MNFNSTNHPAYKTMQSNKQNEVKTFSRNSFGTSNYFAYKKNKIQATAEKTKKPLSKLNFLFQLFIATFIIVFIVIVVAIMKYSSKVDIEYTKGDLSFNNTGDATRMPTYGGFVDEQQQRRIDTRLAIIQQEENAPSEAKIIANDENATQVIDPSHIEESKKKEKMHIAEQEKEIAKQKALGKNSEATSDNKKQEKKAAETSVNKNITVLSKVLIGRYKTFEEASKVQNEIKQRNPSLAPFVRKVGEVFCVQMGSFQEFEVAKKQAQILKAKGFDVWIYQQ